MGFVAWDCAAGDAPSVALPVANTVAIAPPDDSVDTNRVSISGNGYIYSLGPGPVDDDGNPWFCTKQITFTPTSSSQPIVLVQSTTLQMLGGASRTISVPSICRFHWNGAAWVEENYVNLTQAIPGGGGPAGPPGPQGPQGNPGPQGVQGPTGPQGPQGNTGATGATGAAGAQGPQGNPGATGAQGPQGNPGVTGATGPGYQATSATSLTIGTGAKVFTTQAGLAYTVGARARAASNATPTNWMEGLVSAYSGTSLTVNVDLTNGSGSAADWNINLSGQQGTTGPQGPAGPTGPQGPAGSTGPAGPQGSAGATGAGVPVAGTANQVLTKNSATDYDTSWKTPLVDNSAWTAYGVSVGATSGAFGNASATGRYKQIGKTVFVQISLTIVAVGSASGFATATLPVACSGAASFMLAGRENAVVGATVVGLISSGGSSVTIYRYDNTTTIGANYWLLLTGVYEAA
jgi:hypothetical protein